jgi:hypothetical protein
MSKRVPSSTGDRDSRTEARRTLSKAQTTHPSPDQIEALKEAEKLRQASNTYNYLFSSELRRPE